MDRDAILPVPGSLYRLQDSTMGYRQMVGRFEHCTAYTGVGPRTIFSGDLLLYLDRRVHATFSGDFWICFLAEDGLPLWLLFSLKEPEANVKLQRVCKPYGT